MTRRRPKPRTERHPECVKGNHVWVVQRVTRSATIEVCSRCPEVKTTAGGKK